MNKKLYNLMNWADIEEIVYGEAAHPERLLGSHNEGRNSLIQCFFPGASNVSLCITASDNSKGKTVKEEIKMEMADENGYFAALIPGKNRHDYYYHVVYGGKKPEKKDIKETYGVFPIRPIEEYEKALSGSCYDMQNYFGAKKMTVSGTRGVLFSVWAPNALRVSVIGDFNSWNSLEHQMVRDDLTGVFELFVPGIEKGERYKYEILYKGGNVLVKSDPFALRKEEEGNAGEVFSEGVYKWTDSKFCENRKNIDDKCINIYEICQHSFTDDSNIKNITDSVISHMKEYGYNCLELMPVNACFNDSLGYKPSMYFAINRVMGSESDLKYFVNALHNENLRVFVQWSGFMFDEGESGLSSFDGTCLFEHEDYKKGIDVRTGAVIFQYGNQTVESFIISSVLNLLREYHFDGIQFLGLTGILYLDYYRNPGEWVPNIYGTNENLEFIGFIKKLNKVIHSELPGVVTIADEESGWPSLTDLSANCESDNANCLGFDYCINKGFTSDVISYMECDPISRANYHNELVMSTFYQYSERYILSLGHSLVDFGKGGLIRKMSGDENAKLSNLKAFFGYMYTHPGKKLCFTGMDIASEESFDASIPFKTEMTDRQVYFAEYYKQLSKIYSDYPALYSEDYTESGFEWMNNSSSNENVISYLRKCSSDKKDKYNEDTLLVVINFANINYDKYKVGVPAFARYKEIFNSDSTEFGGSGYINSRMLPSKEGNVDGRENYIVCNLAPLSVSIFKIMPYSKEELDKMEAKRIEKEQAQLDKIRKKKALEKEKARIKASLKEELERKIREAEKAIEEGSEYKNDKR